MAHDNIMKSRHHPHSDSRQRGYHGREVGFGGFAAGIILLSWIAFGSIILLGSFGVIDARIADLWPVILILAGANLLLSGGRYRQHADSDETERTPTV